ADTDEPAEAAETARNEAPADAPAPPAAEAAPVRAGADNGRPEGGSPETAERRPGREDAGGEAAGAERAPAEPQRFSFDAGAAGGGGAAPATAAPSGSPGASGGSDGGQSAPPAHRPDADLRDGMGEGRSRRRRRRGRDRGFDAPPAETGGGNQHQRERETRPFEPTGEPIEVQGLLEIRDEGYGFMRTGGFLAGRSDVYVSASQIRRFGMRKGDYLKGATRPAASNEKYPALL